MATHLQPLLRISQLRNKAPFRLTAGFGHRPPALERCPKLAGHASQRRTDTALVGLWRQQHAALRLVARSVLETAETATDGGMHLCKQHFKFHYRLQDNVAFLGSSFVTLQVPFAEVLPLTVPRTLCS